MGTYESAPSSMQQTAPPNLEVPANLPELPETPNETAPQSSGDFYTPEPGELERGEIIDFPKKEGMAELETGEEISPEAKEALDKLAATYPNLYRDASLKELAEESQVETLELLAQARDELELTETLEEADPESLERMELTLTELEPALEEAREKIDQLEDIALELPEDLQAALEDPEKELEQMRYQMEAQEDEFAEAMSRLQREIAVRSFIQDSIEKMYAEYGDVFSRVQNAEAAKQMIAVKISSAVWETAQTFIREGGRPDYGFHMEITITSHEDEDGEEKAYITEIEIEIRGATEADGFRNEEEAA